MRRNNTRNLYQEIEWHFISGLQRTLSMNVVVVQLISCVKLFVTSCMVACQALLSFTISWSVLRLMFIELMISSNYLILSHLLLHLPLIFPSIWSFPMSWLFASGGQSIGASASASVLPMNIQEWFPLGLTDLINLLVVQRILKSLLQHHSSKVSILRHSAFFMVQLSHPYMTTGKTIALTIWTFD